MTWSDETLSHLREHISYPVKGSEILAACEDWKDVPEDEKEKGRGAIDTEKTYNSADEVISELTAKVA